MNSSSCLYSTNTLESPDPKFQSSQAISRMISRVSVLNTVKWLPTSQEPAIGMSLPKWCEAYVRFKAYWLASRRTSFSRVVLIVLPLPHALALAQDHGRIEVHTYSL